MLVLFSFWFLLVSQLRFDKRKTNQPTDNVSHTDVSISNHTYGPEILSLNFKYNFTFTFILIWSNETSRNTSFSQYLPFFSQSGSRAAAVEPKVSLSQNTPVSWFTYCNTYCYTLTTIHRYVERDVSVNI